MTKSDLLVRPIFHRKRDSIETRLTIVFAALAISRRIQALTGISIRRLLERLEPLRTSIVNINGKLHEFPPHLDEKTLRLLKSLKTEIW